jgi:hypothetical protein
MRIVYLMTYIILQDGSRSADDQPRVAEHPSGLGEDPSGHEIEDPPEVPRRRRTRKSHYVAPPPVPTNLESQLIIKPVGER